MPPDTRVTCTAYDDIFGATQEVPLSVLTDIQITKRSLYNIKQQQANQKRRQHSEDVPLPSVPTSSSSSSSSASHAASVPPHTQQYGSSSVGTLVPNNITCPSQLSAAIVITHKKNYHTGLTILSPAVCDMHTDGVSTVLVKDLLTASTVVLRVQDMARFMHSKTRREDNGNVRVLHSALQAINDLGVDQVKMMLQCTLTLLKIYHTWTNKSPTPNNATEN